ncbi:MAG: phosphoribosylformimino-5-aminoimidazole carboxamide ribotide isomerase [Dehalococcoidia bacterium]|nr:phosphoribosylformimino-5-aminoimidazole carboxamide ribotide isomerase [Dehalococcoidia bacterium]
MSPQPSRGAAVRFRPCIDLHEGKVKQIVGATLGEGAAAPVTNFETDRAAADFARLYQRDGLAGGHVIMLGPGNAEAARSALEAYPGGMQVGGGVTPENALDYLRAGASHVIVTSYVFSEGRVDYDNLKRVVDAVGRERLVLDLSCLPRDGLYYVATDRWQRLTDLTVDAANLERLAGSCDEFLVHAVAVEGQRSGVDQDLVRLLGEASPLPTTYAGGASSIEDLDLVRDLGGGRVDLTIGSALDIFGGDVPYDAVVAWQRAEEARQGDA